MDIAQTFAATLVDELAAQGVEYACVSPGSRSAPIAMALQRHPRIKVIIQIDERSGSFFGLGLGKATGKPAVLLCTSGTAAAEFHPAVIEASYSRTPLIVITADRPPELQDVGANQAIDQQHLYGTAVRWFFDPGPPVEIPGAARVWRRLAARAVAEAAGGPVHINLPFREPLVPPPGQAPSAEGESGQSITSGRMLPTQAQLANLASALQGARRPLVVAGEMRDGERLAPALMRLGLPVLAEPGSQLRRAETGGAVEAYEALPPVNRMAWRDEWMSAGKKAGAAMSATLISTPIHEGHIVRALAARLPDAAQVFVGSSMPIRAADSFWPLSKPQQRFFGNRGASGIDGLVSTGLGVATGRSHIPSVLLLGDLSVYHDMNGLWTIGRHSIKATVVVCDNNGGGVFTFLPRAQHPDVFEEIFATPLGLDFAQIARLYGLVYSPVTERSGLEPAIKDAIEKATPTMVVVRFKRDDSVSGHRLCWEAAAAALRS